MKKKWMLIGVVICFSSASNILFAKPSQKSTEIPKGPNIRVLLVKEAPAAFLEVKGPYRVIRKDSGEVLSCGNNGKRFVVHALQEGLRWGEEFPQMNQFTILPYVNTTISVNGLQYLGAMTVYHTSGNRVAIVNEVPLEDFVKSTLTIKCEGDISKVEKEAMAIVERTQAFAQLGSRRPWDVVAEEVKYYGYGVTQQNSNIESEVDATRFMVLESRSGSVKEKKLLPSVELHELAQKGYDAQQILKRAFPQTKLGITIDPNEVAIR